MPESSSSTDGSPPQRVIVGRIGRPFGLSGEVYVRSESDTPDRFAPGAEFLTDEASPRTLRITQCRSHQDKMLVRFGEVTDRTAAEALREVALTIAAENRRKLDDDEFWPDELVGLAVMDTAGRRLGTVADVNVDGPQVQLVVSSHTGVRSVVPFVRELVPEVRVADRVLVIDPIDGLLNPSTG